jgi:transposase
MGKQLVPDTLWEIVEPVLPRPEGTRPPKPKGGWPRVPDRACLTGIVFVLKTGIPWEDLPREMGCGSGMTCWRRLRDWQAAGVWEAVRREVLDRLGAAARIDGGRACLDSASARAQKGAAQPAPARPTAPNRARNATSSPTGAAPRWRSA